MTEQTLARARAGHEDAFRELTDPYQRELQLHIYRIVGSAQDAEDLGYHAGEVAEMLETSEASVNSLLRRARAAFESRLPVTGRERAPIPNSKFECDIVGRFAETVENGDIDRMVALLTDDAWLTMPPLPHGYQGRYAIGAFLRGAEERRGAPMRLVPTRANTQPAFGCYLSLPETNGARAFALLVLTLEGD